MELTADLTQLRDLLNELLDACDVSSASALDAGDVVSELQLLKQRIEAAQLAYGAHAVDGGVHVLTSYVDGVDWYAAKTGSSIGAARAALRLATQLSSTPAVSAAFSSGSLSLEQASEIAPAAVADPATALPLLERVKRSSMVGLKRVARRVVAQASPPVEKAKPKPFFRARVNKNNMYTFEGALPLEEGGEFLDARLKPFIQEAIRNSKNRGEGRDVAMSNALLALLETCGSEKRRRNAELVVIADHDALVRGYALSNEVCEIDGLGPVSVDYARSLLSDCYLSVVMMKNGKPAIVKGKGHYIPDSLRVAVRARDRHCTVPGCESTFRCEIDHIIAVENGGLTVIGNLQLLCKRHHDQKTYRGFRMMGEGLFRKWMPPSPAAARAA